MDDWQLLNEYATRNSEEAFRTLVERYLPMVYHAALRQVYNPHAAEEITQAVFIALAQKAHRISPSVLLYGWLFRATRYAALNHSRADANRRRHEQEAIAMEAASASNDTESLWERIAPQLDDALEHLSQTDRELVMLRFFGNKSHRELARVLGISEDTAKKRLSRAVEKLRLGFSRRGVAVTSAALVAAFSACGAKAAPVGLAASVAAAAFTNGGATSSSVLITAKEILKLMAWTKAKTTVIAAACVLLIAGTATVSVRSVKQHRAETVWNYISPSTDNDIRNRSNWEQLQKAPPAISIRKSKFIQAMANGQSGYGDMLGIYQPFDAVLGRVYDISPCRIVSATPLPVGDFDFIVSGKNPPEHAMEEEIQNKYGITVHHETRDTDVLILKVRYSNAPGLKPAAKPTEPSYSYWGIGHLKRTSSPSRFLANDIEHYLQIPVIDNTGITKYFDYELTWDDDQQWDDSGHCHFTNPEGLKQALLDQLGLELVPGRARVEVLVVDQAK